MKTEKEQAEEKPVKVGEPYSESQGNTEPSIVSMDTKACVETRRQVCIKCGGDIPSTKYSNAKYCSDRCRNAFIALRHAHKTGRIKNPGVGSGGAQWGEDNHQYRTGIGQYSNKGFKAHGRKCNRCEDVAVLIRHKDHNRENNSIDNLEPLCKRCHQEHHAVRDELGRYTKV